MKMTMKNLFLKMIVFLNEERRREENDLKGIGSCQEVLAPQSKN